MNFFINRAMGLGNSGIEHAQFYRAKCFDLVKIPYKFVFMELVPELHEAMAAWNLAQDQVINIWEYFVLDGGTGDYLQQGAEASYPRKERILLDHTNTHRIKESDVSSGMIIVEHEEKSQDPKNKDMLLVSPYQVELINRATGAVKVRYKLIEIPHRGWKMSNIHIYDFRGEDLFFRNEVLFQRFFIKEVLNPAFDDAENVYFLDRGQETEEALYGHKSANMRLVDVIHADHLDNRLVPTAVLWNNWYEYLLTHVEETDAVVVSTEKQREDLMIEFSDLAEKFVTIPVGGVRDFTADDHRGDAATGNKFRKFVTASRLASEKHIDLVIRAIARVHQDFPEISFDIYGQGGEEGKLRETIEEVKAEDFVNLKGHSSHLESIYPQYDAFISGSYSEGFGLTFIEAMNAGLPVVAYDARFGAQELVKSGENGFLVKFSREDDNYSIDQLEAGIRQLLSANKREMVQATLASVKDYQDSVIADKWKELIHAL